MNNIERYEAFNKELRKLLTLYEEIYFRNDGTYNKDSRTFELFEESPSALFVLYTEFCPKDDEEMTRVHIHYDIKYWGSSVFNNLLEKYNMCMEWENSAILYIYDNEDSI